MDYPGEHCADDLFKLKDGFILPLEGMMGHIARCLLRFIKEKMRWRGIALCTKDEKKESRD